MSRSLTLSCAQCFHERRDVDVIHTAALNVRNRAVFATLPQIVLRQARGLTGFRIFALKRFKKTSCFGRCKLEAGPSSARGDSGQRILTPMGQNSFPGVPPNPPSPAEIQQNGEIILSAKVRLKIRLTEKRVKLEHDAALCGLTQTKYIRQVCLHLLVRLPGGAGRILRCTPLPPLVRQNIPKQRSAGRPSRLKRTGLRPALTAARPPLAGGQGRASTPEACTP